MRRILLGLAVGALAPAVERELGEHHEVAAFGRGLGDPGVDLVQRRGLVARHRLEVDAGHGDRRRTEGGIIRAHDDRFAYRSTAAPRVQNRA